jgi:hypothetical protein
VTKFEDGFEALHLAEGGLQPTQDFFYRDFPFLGDFYASVIFEKAFVRDTNQKLLVMKNNAFTWDIQESGILDINGNPIKGYKQITRDDNGSSIAVMKSSYTPMTTQEFSNTAYAVVEQVGGKIKENSFKDWNTTDKEINRGSASPVITCQIEISEPLEIAGSKIEGWLTLGVGFDGGRSFFIGHTNNYLRCTNAFGSIVKDFTSRLTKNHMVRVKDIINNVGLYREYERKLYENFVKFQTVKVDDKIVQECVARLIGLSDEERLLTPKELEKQLPTIKLNKRDDILASVRTEMAELGNNAWGLFNGVTHYTTHVMSSRGSDEMSTMFGAKNTANQIAYNLGIELMNA